MSVSWGAGCDLKLEPVREALNGPPYTVHEIICFLALGPAVLQPFHNKFSEGHAKSRPKTSRPSLYPHASGFEAGACASPSLSLEEGLRIQGPQAAVLDLRRSSNNVFLWCGQSLHEESQKILIKTANRV